MILITHILIALSSMLLASYLIFKPSQKLINTTYGLTAATLATGTYLVIASSSKILQSCITGLLYVGFVTVGVVIAQVRLSRANAHSND
jgi:hypothetical protein